MEVTFQFFYLCLLLLQACAWYGYRVCWCVDNVYKLSADDLITQAGKYTELPDMVSMSYPRLHVNVIVLSCQHYRKSLRKKYVDHYSFCTCREYKKVCRCSQDWTKSVCKYLVSAREY